MVFYALILISSLPRTSVDFDSDDESVMLGQGSVDLCLERMSGIHVTSWVHGKLSFPSLGRLWDDLKHVWLMTI